MPIFSSNTTTGNTTTSSSSNPTAPGGVGVTSSSSGKNKSTKDPLNPSKEEKQLIQELRKQNEQFKVAKEQAEMKVHKYY